MAGSCFPSFCCKLLHASTEQIALLCRWASGNHLKRNSLKVNTYVSCTIAAASPKNIAPLLSNSSHLKLGLLLHVSFLLLLLPPIEVSPAKQPRVLFALLAYRRCTCGCCWLHAGRPSYARAEDPAVNSASSMPQTSEPQSSDESCLTIYHHNHKTATRQHDFHAGGEC